MHKKRWKWSDAGSNEPVLVHQLMTTIRKIRTTNSKTANRTNTATTEPPSEPLDNFNDDKHVRENTYF